MLMKSEDFNIFSLVKRVLLNNEMEIQLNIHCN